MVQTFAVNSSNDLFIGNDGNLSIANGIDAVRFACLSAAKALLGEMIYAITSGVPYFQTVWIGTPKLLQFQSTLRNTLLGVSGVTGVQNLVLSQAGNVLQYEAIILTIYGRVTING